MHNFNDYESSDGMTRYNLKGLKILEEKKVTPEVQARRNRINVTQMYRQYNPTVGLHRAFKGLVKGY